MLLPSAHYMPTPTVSQSISRPYQPLQPRIQVLAWLDDAKASTGFGVVARHILTTIHNTGLYEIHHLAINHHGEFADKKEIPWDRQPARLLDPNDPHGIKMFLQSVARGNYDLIFVCNDVYVTREATQSLTQILQEKAANHKKIPKIIYYYPVDCHVLDTANSFIKLADCPVCYTKHGREETLLTTPEVSDRLVEIPHGVNTDVFRPLPLDVKNQIKQQMLRANSDTFVVINVNRNSARKQIAYSIACFKEFKKQVPNSKMYIHTAVRDQGGDLTLAIKDMRLSTTEDVIFPINYSPANGVPDDTLNGFYNMADMFLSCHLGEGWGLTVGEAMAAGTPVIVPNNTSMPTLLGDNSERGWMYDCKDVAYIDDSGGRKKGYMLDIVNKMIECYTNKEETRKKVQLAREWCLSHQWKDIGTQWIQLFAKVLSSQITRDSKIASEVL